MAQGWVNGATEVTDERWPGFRIIEHSVAHWKMIDAYCVTPQKQ